MGSRSSMRTPRCETLAPSKARPFCSRPGGGTRSRADGLTVAFISHADCGRHDTGWEHPEHVGRLRAITTALRGDPELFMAVQHIEGRHATVDELALVHDPGYIGGI